jgi:hypothetical protein
MRGPFLTLTFAGGKAKESKPKSPDNRITYLDFQIIVEKPAREERQSMKRTFRLWRCILVGCLVVSWGHAVEAAGTTPQPKPAAPEASQKAPVVQVLESTFDFGESFE